MTDTDTRDETETAGPPYGVPSGSPDDGVPPALADRLERIEASLAWLCAFAESVQTALQRLEGHPMLGKLFNRPDGDVSNGNGY